MLKIVLSSLALGFTANAVIAGLATGALAWTSVPVACALLIVATLYGFIGPRPVQGPSEDRLSLSPQPG